MSFKRRFLDPPEPDEHPLCRECDRNDCPYPDPCQEIKDAIEKNEAEIREHEEKWLREREAMMDQRMEREI